jgi:hypothetical protein
MNVAIDAATIFEKMLTLSASGAPPPDPRKLYRYYACEESLTQQGYKRICTQVPPSQAAGASLEKIYVGWPQFLDTPILSVSQRKIVTRVVPVNQS